ncbi:MAG: hypothetical protein HPPSJP_1160 [Candidatus Hepatoplasma scabrum]|nr:MAG: hypothetical protein HPPSJP_1160 [Candidatus Hepatoplasma sp.]
MKYIYRNVKIKDIEKFSKLYSDFFEHEIQRNFIWNTKKQDLLISTLWENLPMPSVVIFSNHWFEKEFKDGEKDLRFKELKVLDGRQRLTTILNYINGKIDFKNSGKIPAVNKYEGLKFNELDQKEQNEFKELRISVCYLYKNDNNVEEDQNLYNIFERLNTGGINLNAQEVRMSIYPSELCKFLRSTQNEIFYKKMYGEKHKLFSLNQEKRMGVLEFLTYLIMMFESKEFKMEDGSATNLRNYYKRFSDETINFNKLNNLKLRNEFIQKLNILINSYNIALKNLDNKRMESPLYFYVIFNLYLKNKIINYNMSEIELTKKIENILSIKELDDQQVKRHPRSKLTRNKIQEIIIKDFSDKYDIKDQNKAIRFFNY